MGVSEEVKIFIAVFVVNSDAGRNGAKCLEKADGLVNRNRSFICTLIPYRSCKGIT